MIKILLVIGIMLILLFAIHNAPSTSKFEIHAKVSGFAHDNGLTYREAYDYCGEALEKGFECYYIN